MVHQDGVHGPQNQPDERDRDRVLDERGYEPDGHFKSTGAQRESGWAGKKPREEDSPDGDKGVNEERKALSDLSRRLAVCIMSSLHKKSRRAVPFC